MKDRIEKQITRGRPASSDDYRCAMVHKEQEREEKIHVLQAAIDKGEESGVVEGFSMEELPKELDQERDASQ